MKIEDLEKNGLYTEDQLRELEQDKKFLREWGLSNGSTFRVYIKGDVEHSFLRSGDNFIYEGSRPRGYS